MAPADLSGAISAMKPGQARAHASATVEVIAHLAAGWLPGVQLPDELLVLIVAKLAAAELGALANSCASFSETLRALLALDPLSSGAALTVLITPRSQARASRLHTPQLSAIRAVCWGSL